jgi:hypothetical protein
VYGEAPPAPKQAAAAAKKEDAAAGQEKIVERKIIYNSTLNIEVEDFAKAEEELMRLLEEHEGLLETSETDARPGSARTGRWKVRVPAGKLTSFRKGVAKLGQPDQNRLESQEVTEEFYDLVEQIKSKEKEVESYRKLFEETKAISEIVVVKRELDRAQQELDRAKGRHKLLDNLTGLATVNISMRERGAYTPEQSPDFATSVDRTFSDSFAALTTFGRGVALFLVALAPWLPVILLVTIPLVVWQRRSRRREAAKINPTPVPVLESGNPVERK